MIKEKLIELTNKAGVKALEIAGNAKSQAQVLVVKAAIKTSELKDKAAVVSESANQMAKEAGKNVGRVVSNVGNAAMMGTMVAKMKVASAKEKVSSFFSKEEEGKEESGLPAIASLEDFAGENKTEPSEEPPSSQKKSLKFARKSPPTVIRVLSTLYIAAFLLWGLSHKGSEK